MLIEPDDVIYWAYTFCLCFLNTCLCQYAFKCSCYCTISTKIQLDAVCAAVIGSQLLIK
jgi:hypothetical protein